MQRFHDFESKLLSKEFLLRKCCHTSVHDLRRRDPSAGIKPRPPGIFPPGSAAVVLLTIPERSVEGLAKYQISRRSLEVLTTSLRCFCLKSRPWNPKYENGRTLLILATSDINKTNTLCTRLNEHVSVEVSSDSWISAPRFVYGN